VIQDRTIWATFPQTTASMPSPTAPKPTMAPTIEWVVETGRPMRVASNSSVPAEASAPSMPNLSRSGCVSKSAASTMPFRTVSVT